MPVWPKCFSTFRVSLKTAATEWHLRKNRTAPVAQQTALTKLTSRLVGASYWKGLGVEARMPYATFRTKVPVSTYEQLIPAIDRMVRGEADVLWPGRCSLFALSAGTSSGQPKRLPVTEELLTHFRSAGHDALLYYNVRVRHAGAFRGRHLLFGSPTRLIPIGTPGAEQAYAGEMSGIAALSLPRWAEKHLYEPGTGVGQIEDLDDRIAAIAKRTTGADITLIAGLPNWVTILAHALREHASASRRRITHLAGLWPNLECYVYSGMLIGPYANELRVLLGPALNFHEVYAASEGFFAAQDADSSRGMRLMVDQGVFYEFIAVADLDDTPPELVGRKALPLEGVKAGVDYALVITTPGGLVRYLVGDIVRFTSTAPARVIYIGGLKQRLNAFAENISEREACDALVAVCQRRGWTIVNFHVAPLHTGGSSFTRQHRGRHEWWVELRPGTVSTPTGPQMATDLDTELQRANSHYAAARQASTIDPPFVRLVMPGVFEHWLRFRKQWGGQFKVPRCRSDRTIADQLSQVTHFARD